MKKLFLLMVLMSLPLVCRAQERKYSTFYYQRTTLFEQLPVTSRDIVFLGNSITNGAEWGELFNDSRVKNRGISGDVCMGVYDRLDAVLKGKPTKIFLLIGINDVSRGAPCDTIVAHIGMIVRKIKMDSPKTELYVQSILPVTDCYKMFRGHTARWRDIPEINGKLEVLAEKEGVVYIDLYSHFTDKKTGKMNEDYTNDGLHLLGAGYLKWVEIIRPYVEKK